MTAPTTGLYNRAERKNFMHSERTNHNATANDSNATDGTFYVSAGNLTTTGAAASSGSIPSRDTPSEHPGDDIQRRKLQDLEHCCAFWA